MKKSDYSNEVMKILRSAADLLDEMPAEKTVIFPGWDTESEKQEGNEILLARCIRIRTAAEAVLAAGKTADQGTKVPLKFVGVLVCYLADMLEE